MSEWIDPEAKMPGRVEIVEIQTAKGIRRGMWRPEHTGTDYWYLTDCGHPMQNAVLPVEGTKWRPTGNTDPRSRYGQ